MSRGAGVVQLGGAAFRSELLQSTLSHDYAARVHFESSINNSLCGMRQMMRTQWPFPAAAASAAVAVLYEYSTRSLSRVARYGELTNPYYNNSRTETVVVGPVASFA